MSDIISAALAKENIIEDSDVVNVTDTTAIQPETVPSKDTSEKIAEKDIPTADTDSKAEPNNDNISPNSEDQNSQDDENQIAAVLTEMQNAGDNVAPVVSEDKSEEAGNQESFEPSIAVIMQDESATADPEQVTSQAQVQLTPDQLEVMHSGQIPSQASLYTLGNIVLILSPDVMAAGGLTQEQIQQIQESQANAALSNVQEGTAISLNVDGSVNTQPVVPASSTASTASTKESQPAEKKAEEAKDKDKPEDLQATKDVSKEAKTSETKTLPPEDSSKTTPSPVVSEQSTGSEEKQKAGTDSISDEAKPKEDQIKSSKEAPESKPEKSSDKPEKTKCVAETDKDKNSKQVESQREFKCNFCADSYNKKEQLDAHVKTHNRRKRIARQPAKASPEAASKPSRPKRGKTVKSDEDGTDAPDVPDEKSSSDPFHCEICSDSFSAELKLRKHLTTHNVNKRLHCDGCKVPFAFQYQLDRHIRRNTGDQPYKCDKCEESFPLRCHFNFHLRLHNPKKLHECEHCGKTFNSVANLRGHIRIHTGEKPYKCDICEKCFTEYSSLAKHRRAHTGERPFKCTHCEKAFTQSGGLKAHLRTHTGERPFKCDLCERSFAKEYNLKTHKRTHTGEKPYKCEICGVLFSQHSTLAQHVRRHQNKAQKAKVTIAQQTTGNPELDIVESHPVPQDNTMLQEQQVPTGGVTQPIAQIEVQAAVDGVKPMQTAEEETSVINEAVVNERTEAEEMVALQEASQAIQMLQMQQLVNQVEEVVTQAALSQISQT